MTEASTYYHTLPYTKTTYIVAQVLVYWYYISAPLPHMASHGNLERLLAEATRLNGRVLESLLRAYGRGSPSSDSARSRSGRRRKSLRRRARDRRSPRSSHRRAVLRARTSSRGTSTEPSSEGRCVWADRRRKRTRRGDSSGRGRARGQETIHRDRGGGNRVCGRPSQQSRQVRQIVSLTPPRRVSMSPRVVLRPRPRARTAGHGSGTPPTTQSIPKERVNTEPSWRMWKTAPTNNPEPEGMPDADAVDPAILKMYDDQFQRLMEQAMMSVRRDHEGVFG